MAIDHFYEALSRTLRRAGRRAFVWIGEDFNARLGLRGRYHELDDVLGPYGLWGGGNDRDNRLLLTANGFYKHKDSRYATWYHLRFRFPAMLNLVLVRQRHLGNITDVAAKPGIDVNSDHVMVVSMLTHLPRVVVDAAAEL